MVVQPDMILGAMTLVTDGRRAASLRRCASAELAKPVSTIEEVYHGVGILSQNF